MIYSIWSREMNKMDIETIAEKLDTLFADAIDVDDTIWYSEVETLRDAILDLFVLVKGDES